MTRIQHGVRSIESPKLVRQLKEMGAVLDVCPISNVKLGVVESMSDHPIRELMREGVTCTLSTDVDRVAIVWDEFGRHIEAIEQLVAEFEDRE